MKLQTIPADAIDAQPSVKVTNAVYERLYREDMKGCIASIYLDLVAHTAIVTTASGHVDMTGCIATVMMLDPDIENIQTINGNAFLGGTRVKDTQYLKDQQTGWSAVCWDRSEPTRTGPHGTDFVVKKLRALLLAALRATKRLAKLPHGAPSDRLPNCRTE